jgi:ABC-type lipoprotein export system ATPase subunit
MSAVEARDVFRVHSTPEGDAAALQGLTLSVEAGEVVAVVGPSGAGKTSLLRVLAGADRPSAGSVRVFEWDVPTLNRRALARYRANVLGYVDQHYSAALDPLQPIVDSVSTRLRLERVRAPRRRASELLDAVGLGSRLDARPSQLSGGEQQRAAVCAAVAHRPRLLLADEPTGELDRDNADAVFGLIGELARRDGTTVVIVSHDRRVAQFVDRVVRIRDGRVSEEQRGGVETIVVDRGGWLRLPTRLLRAARVGERVEARLEEERIVITPADEPVRDREASMPTGSDGGPRERVLEVRSLAKRYGDRVVLDDFAADVERGALTCVTGPSGSGKTTLLDLIAGLERADAGTIRLAGTEVTRLGRDQLAELRATRIGYVAQQPVLVPFLSARENVELALALRGRDGDALAELAAVGLAERSEQLVARLAAGERLRVALARALVGRPDVLVADEPTSRLDERNARVVTALLAHLARERRAAVVVATHDPIVVEQADTTIALG